VKFIATALPGVVLVEPKVYGDDRGYFFESFRAEAFREHGLPASFVQDNVSRSSRGVLRGLHLQSPFAQGKLVGVLQGEVFDVAVDVRRGSPQFGRWFGARLSSDNKRMMYLPPGFAHGFLVTSDDAIFAYKCTEVYHPEAEQSIRWNDPAIGIEWPQGEVIQSARDAAAPLLGDIEPSRLETYTAGSSTALTG